MSAARQEKSTAGPVPFDGRTYSAQASLPRLPIPTLEETMERFPKAVWAIQTPEEREETREVVEEFLGTDGPELQALLKDYDEEGAQGKKLGSYVEEFWSDAYLAPETSVVMNLNPFFLLEDGPDAKLAKDQVGRAASLVFASIKMASSLRRENLAPDAFRGKSLCMDQFKALFGSARVPKVGEKDVVEVDPDSRHIVVMARNQFYYFTALWADGAVAVTVSDLKEIFSAILGDAKSMDPDLAMKHALGALTTLNRNEWSVLRGSLHDSSPHNAAALEIVDSALFVLCLDDFTPADVHEGVANMLHGTYRLESKTDVDCVQRGTCCNRWYDKLQIIVCADGSAGVNFEHSAIDGHTALRYASDAYAETIVAFAQSITQAIYGKGSPEGIPAVIRAEVRRAAGMVNEDGRPIGIDTSPKKLEIDVPGNVLDRIYYAETALGDEIFASDVYALEFREYGKNFITGNKMSPDSFVQMSMLVAYYALYGKVVCSYEPVLTKQFYHGRTEAMRAATPEARALCEAFTSHFTTNQEKLGALIKATKEHSRLVKEASSGKGVDRHLFALKCIAEKKGKGPLKFFQSKAWAQLNHTVLSTSNCGNPALRHFGFGPVVPDGFGIGYIIKEDGLQYSISSKHRQTRRYAMTLLKVLLEFEKLMTPLSSVSVSRSQTVQGSGGGKTIDVDCFMDYLGCSMDDEKDAVAPLVDAGPALQRNDSSKFLGRVFRRQSSVSKDALKRVGKRVGSPLLTKDDADYL